MVVCFTLLTRPHWRTLLIKQTLEGLLCSWWIGSLSLEGGMGASIVSAAGSQVYMLIEPKRTGEKGLLLLAIPVLVSRHNNKNQGMTN